LGTHRIIEDFSPGSSPPEGLILVSELGVPNYFEDFKLPPVFPPIPGTLKKGGFIWCPPT